MGYVHDTVVYILLTVKPVSNVATVPFSASKRSFISSCHRYAIWYRNNKNG